MILEYKKLYNDSKNPEKANPEDAGFDVFAHSMRIEGKEIKSGIYSEIQYISYKVGISIRPNSDSNSHYFSYLAPRSSISKYNLTMANSFGVIDRNYRGELEVRFRYVAQASDYVFFSPDKHPCLGIIIDESKIYKIGDKIAQLVVTTQPNVALLECSNPDWNDTSRGAGGFGSSGS